MALFDQWLYVNIHNLNTDWLVKTVKEVKDKTDLIDEAVTETENYAHLAEEAKNDAHGYAEDANRVLTDMTQKLDDWNTNSSSLIAQVTANTQNININSQRIDNIISGTTPDANVELIDIRTAYDGQTYPTAGDAVRDQIQDVIDTIGLDPNKHVLPTNIETDYYVQADGTIRSLAGYVSTEYIEVYPYKHVSIYCTLFTGISFVICDRNHNALKFINGTNATTYGYISQTQPQTVDEDLPDGAWYIRASMRSTFYSSPSDFNIILSKPENIYDKIKNTEVIVGSNGDYTSILNALKSTDDKVKIKVLAGTYDIVQEYIDYYGSTFWDNYRGYAGETDNFYKGLWINNGREIEFETKAIVTFNYTGNNNNVRVYFSVFATGYNTRITNLHLIHNNNCRYAIHDDFASQSGTNIIEKCIFDGGSAVGYEIGGGMGANNLYVIDHCIFLNNTGTNDISYHNNGGATALNKVQINDCYGNKACRFAYHGTSTSKTVCSVNSSHFSAINKVAETSGSLVDNIDVIQWCNDIG